MPGWDDGTYKFQVDKQDSIYTSDANGLRSTRVIVSEQYSGSAVGSVALTAYDAGGTPKRILATEIPDKPGFFALSTDTELNLQLSGSNFYISDIRIGSMDQTSGSTRYLLVNTAGQQFIAIASSSYYSGLSENTPVVPLCNLNGVLETYTVSALNTTNDSIKNEPIVPTEVLGGGKVACSMSVGVPVQISSTSLNGKRGAKIRIDPRTGYNAMAVIYNSATNYTAVSADGEYIAGLVLTRDDPGMQECTVDDISKCFCSSNGPGVCICWEFV